MTNVLNSILANQPIYPDKKQENASFSIDSEGKVKPMEYKGKLLPSRIIGSPIEYVKDLKKDVVSIGKAAKGEANDHELGRINDLAMKLGSLGLAAYLFVKNPLKLSKTMEFVGFGTFFASMALWPKLAIQAPLKARTGVDIHQKYVDSQGRKKMLYQDPQYVLTDLYTKEDLNKIGKKLNINEKLPDRDSFIKQRAQKTALQGNTLWMMTAGFASPIMSGLACNVLEKPIGDKIEKHQLEATADALENGTTGIFEQFKQNRQTRQLDNFLAAHQGERLADIKDELSSILANNSNSATLQSVIAEDLGSMTREVTLDMDFVKNALKSKVPAEVFENMPEAQRAVLQSGIENGSVSQIAKAFPRAQQKEITKLLDVAVKQGESAVLDEGTTATIKQLHTNLTEFASKKGIIDRFIHARVGDEAGTYIANQWGKTGKELIKSLGLKTKDMKEIANGNAELFEQKMTELAADPDKFEKVMSQLTKMVADYEEKTDALKSKSFVKKFNDLFTNAAERMRNTNFHNIAKKLSSSVTNEESTASAAGTVKQVVNAETVHRVTGAKASLYRLLQTLDLYKQIKDGTFKETLTECMRNANVPTDEENVGHLLEICKQILVGATSTHHAEKLTTATLGLSEGEYKAAMNALFGDKSTQNSALSGLNGFREYKEMFIQQVANWRNGITPHLSRFNANNAGNSSLKANSDLIGKSVFDFVKEHSKKIYNSKKWLHIFGGAMAALTAVTLIAGLLIGRKSEAEKQVEAENNLNG